MIYLILGFLRLGFVTHFLSRPIISAFLTAGTIIISLSQVSSSSATCHFICTKSSFLAAAAFCIVRLVIRHVSSSFLFFCIKLDLVSLMHFLVTLAVVCFAVMHTSCTVPLCHEIKL